MSNFAKPENALMRCEELLNVGQRQVALQTLHDLIVSKRFRSWQKPLEKIMMKYVELCVEQRKGRFAKDGLIQYRIVCQQVNVSSLEDVIKHFMKLSTEKAEEAQALVAAVTAEAEESDLQEVKDLEEEGSPEDLMLSYVSGEKGRERVGKETVTPWFKFLWETYRTVLEILRNNSKLETLYAMTAHKAFQFCLTHKRGTEFRRLCEILRNHLANLNKYRDQRDRPDLTQPESLQLYMDTRFEQLKVATELDLWQEAFRSVEDIHGLMTLVKKTPKPQLMAVYYAKLTEIFRRSGSPLYHAYAWYRLYALQKSFNKNLKERDLALMASSVVLATLAISPCQRRSGAAHAELEVERERNARMAALLGFSSDGKNAGDMLSKAALLQELTSKGLLAYVLPEVKSVHSLLETEFHPLDLGVRAAPLLAHLATHSERMSAASPIAEVQLDQYVPGLERVAALKLLHQSAQVFDTMKLANLVKMLPFGDVAFVEKTVVEAVKHGYVAVKLNHKQGTVHFGSQDLESDKIRQHIVVLAKRLNRAVQLIHPTAQAARHRGARPGADVAAAVAAEHDKLLARKFVIERRKEEAEREIIEKEREEKSEKLKAQRLTEEAEAKRLAAEQARRLEERIRKEMEEKELAEARALLEDKLKKDAGKKKGKKGVATLDVDGKLDKQSLLQAALEEQLKEKAELERKIQKTAKAMDHLERAKREEERPLIEQLYEQKKKDDEVYHNREQAAILEQSKQQHIADLAEKQRLARMLEDKELFSAQVVSRRAEEFSRLRREREEKLAEAREMRRAERETARKREWVRRTEEAKARKKLEEELTRKREEEDRKRAEEEERLRKLDEIAAKQRQREAEAEEKLKREKAEALERSERSSAARFTPSALRGRGAASGDAPPGAERASSGGSRFVPPALRQREAAPAGRGPEEEKWGSSRSAAVPAAERGGGRWGSSSSAAASAPSAPPPAAERPKAAEPVAGAPKKYVPRHLRGST